MLRHYSASFSASGVPRNGANSVYCVVQSASAASPTVSAKASPDQKAPDRPVSGLHKNKSAVLYTSKHNADPDKPMNAIFRRAFVSKQEAVGNSGKCP